MQIDDVLTKDILLPAWNVEDRKPSLFSGFMKNKYKNSEYKVPLSNSVFATASDPVYFDAANLTYTDADNK
jgi:hypothetical protein